MKSLKNRVCQKRSGHDIFNGVISENCPEFDGLLQNFTAAHHILH